MTSGAASTIRPMRGRKPAPMLHTVSNLFVITGSSRGLGEAITRALLQAGHVVIGIARHRNDTLDAQATTAGARLDQWPLDLADAPGAAMRLSAWLRTQNPERYTTASLINNAGVLSRLGPLDDADPAELSSALRVSLEAALLLSAVFVRDTRAWRAKRRLLNISSGLGRRPMSGSAAYCAAKAGMDHFSRVMALDEEALGNPARVVSLAPGIIDTGMQAQLRAADPDRFSEHANFVRFKDAGMLDTPGSAAAKIVAFLNRPDFGSNPVTDIRNE